MIASAKRYMTAIAAAALITVAVSACGGGGGDGGGDGPVVNGPDDNGPDDNGPDDNGPDDNGPERVGGTASLTGSVRRYREGDINGPEPPANVDLSRVTPGFMAGAGTVTILASESEDHGDIAFACATGGDDCTVMVTVGSDGTITATSTGGMVTAMDVPEPPGSERSIPQGDASAWANKFDLVANNRRSDGNSIIGAAILVENSVSANLEDAPRASHATISHTYVEGSSANVIISHDDDGKLQFNISIYQNNNSSLSPWFPDGTYAYRYVDTYENSQDIDNAISSRRSITDHGLGPAWQVEELTNDYNNGGTLSIYIATDLQQSDMATDPAATARAIGDEIQLNVPDIPDDQDALQIRLEPDESIPAIVDGDTNWVVRCEGYDDCIFIRDHSSSNFYTTSLNVVLRKGLEFVSPGQQPTRERVERRWYGSAVPADYLAFGNWLYVPEDTTDTLDYDFGVFATGGDPFDVGHIKGLSGTATYEGDAAGLYYVDGFATNPNIGAFIADVVLNAEFGTNGEHGRVSGEVNNFVFDDPTSSSHVDVSSSFPTAVTLTANAGDWLAQNSYVGIVQGETNIFGISANQIQSIIGIYSQPGGWIEGLTSASAGGETWQGRWNGKFYGNGASPTDHPTSIAGVFGSSNNASGLAGSFGAHRQ